MPPRAVLDLSAAPSVVVDGAPPRPLAARDAALLAWLALEGPTLRSRLAALLWPDSAVEAARSTLRQRVFQLNRQFAVPLVGGGSILALADGVEADLAGTDDLLGTLTLEGCPEFCRWLALQRERRASRMRLALAELADLAEQAHEHADALIHAQELLALEPLSEVAHRRVIRLHYLDGDRAAALLAFDRCEQLLRDEVGATPSAETLALLQTLNAARPQNLVRRQPPVALLRPPRLVGRDLERHTVANALAQRSVVLLFGEAGMGKSRLIADLLDTPPDPASPPVAVGARPGDQAVPFALLARWLRLLLPPTLPPALPPALRLELARVMPELGPAPPPSAADDRARLVSAVESVLADAVARGAAAMLLDDLHHADPGSLGLLQSLVGHGGCGWLLAMRPAEGGAELQTLLQAQQATATVTTVQLQALDTDGIRQLLDAVAVDGIGGAQQAEQLHRRTGGNPLYLLETLKALLAEPTVRTTTGIRWPRADNVQRLIQRRLGQLSPLALKVVRCAAVAGQDLSATLVAQVLGLRPLDLADAWAELEAAQVLRDGVFAHDLVAEAALGTVPAAIAGSLHAEIAGYLEQAGADPAHLADHWVAGGRPLLAVPHLTRAARRAEAQWQKGQAAALHEQAALILRAAGERTAAFDAYFAAAHAASELAADARLHGYAQALKELADSEGQWAALACLQVFLLAETGDLEAALQAARDGQAMAQRAGLADIEVELLWSLTALHNERGELVPALRYAEQASALLPMVNHQTARLPLLGTELKLAAVIGEIQQETGHHEHAQTAFLHAREVALRDHELVIAMDLEGKLAEAALVSGRLDEALCWSERAVAAIARAGTGTPSCMNALLGHARATASGGLLGPALAALEQAVAMTELHIRRGHVQSCIQLHLFQHHLGRRDLATRGVLALAHQVAQNPADALKLQMAHLILGLDADGDAVLDTILAIENFGRRARALCWMPAACDPTRMLPLLAVSASTARDQRALGLWLDLQTCRLAALRAAGRSHEGRDIALEMWRQIEAGVAGREMFPRVAAELCVALSGVDQDLAEVVHLRATAWMQQAAATLPPAWRGNYLSRAPVLELLQTGGTRQR